MSEHHKNPQALLAATLPALLPPGYVANCQLGMRVMHVPSIQLALKEHIRTTEAGTTEVMNPDTGEWKPLRPGVTAHPLGEPLSPEKCVVAFVPMSAVVDTLDKGIVGPAGQPAQRAHSVIGHGVLMALPLVEWQKQHLGNLRGPTD